MMGLPGDVAPRCDASGHPINRAFADLTFDKPTIEAEPGFEGKIHAFNLYDHIARADVTWNPSFTSITRACICCVTSEEHMLPVIHGNDRNEWFIQLSDEIHWNIQDKNTGNPRGRIVMKSGDVCAMPADIRHQGFSPKRSMLMVLENGTPGLDEKYASGELEPFPITAAHLEFNHCLFLSTTGTQIFNNVYSAVIRNSIFMNRFPTGTFSSSYLNNLCRVAGTFPPSPSNGNTASGNIEAIDPLFVNTPVSSLYNTLQDYHLQAGSAAIGTGNDGTDIGVHGGFTGFSESGEVLINPIIRAMSILNTSVVSNGTLNVQIHATKPDSD
jgi:hypothetical protein